MSEDSGRCAGDDGAPAAGGPVRISIAAQLDPIWRHGRAGERGPADVKLFVEQMTAYLAQNLEGFADPRGGDVFVAVSVQKDGETAAHEYRSGHYVKDDPPATAGAEDRPAETEAYAMSEVIERPNGKPYRPRRVTANAVTDEDDLLSGVMVLGTHDPGRAQPLADGYAVWQLGSGHVAVDPVTGWWRNGYSSGRLCWIADEAHGRAGVWFREIVEGVREVSPRLWTSGPSLVELDAYGADPREDRPAVMAKPFACPDCNDPAPHKRGDCPHYGVAPLADGVEDIRERNA